MEHLLRSQVLVCVLYLNPWMHSRQMEGVAILYRPQLEGRQIPFDI